MTDSTNRPNSDNVHGIETDPVHFATATRDRRAVQDDSNGPNPTSDSAAPPAAPGTSALAIADVEVHVTDQDPAVETIDGLRDSTPVPSTIDAQQHTLEDVISREVLITNRLIQPGTFVPVSVSDTTSPLVSLELPTQLINANLDIHNKLAGFTYYTPTIALTLTLNSTPMQHMALWCVVDPMPDRTGKVGYYNPTTKEDYSSMGYILTARKGEIIMVNGTTVRTFILPYAMPFDAMRVDDNIFKNTWSFKVYALTPLHSPDNAPITLQIKGHLVNPAPRLPVAEPVENTMMKVINRMPPHKAAKLLQSLQRNASDHIQSHSVEGEIQMLGGKGRMQEAAISQQNEETVQKKGGFISGIAKAVGTAANYLGDVPVLGAIAKPVGVVANVIGTITGQLGLSNLTEEKQPQTIRYDRTVCRRNVIDCQPIQTLDPYQGASTDLNFNDLPVAEDEMSI